MMILQVQLIYEVVTCTYWTVNIWKNCFLFIVHSFLCAAFTPIVCTMSPGELQKRFRRDIAYKCLQAQNMCLPAVVRSFRQQFS